MTFDCIDHRQAFTDGTGHRLLTPNILPGLGCFHSHESVPVWWRHNMHHINIFMQSKLSKVCISFHIPTDHFLCSLQMITIHITERNRPALIVQVSSSHRSHADYSFCQLIRWGYPSVPSQHMTWNDGKCSRRKAGLLQKTSSAFFFHSFD